MDAYQPTPMDRHSAKAWHRFIEATKFGYAKRTEMGDWNFPPIREHVAKIVKNLTSQDYVEEIKSQIDDSKTFSDPRHYGAEDSLTEDHGTCQHSFLSPDGDAVSVTASVNLIWGCKFMSPSTGIILNNQMDDFASPNITSAYDVPPSPNNYIAPGKRPMSSMSTTIAVDDQVSTCSLFLKPSQGVDQNDQLCPRGGWWLWREPVEEPRSSQRWLKFSSARFTSDKPSKKQLMREGSTTNCSQ